MTHRPTASSTRKRPMLRPSPLLILQRQAARASQRIKPLVRRAERSCGTGIAGTASNLLGALAIAGIVVVASCSDKDSDGGAKIGEDTGGTGGITIGSGGNAGGSTASAGQGGAAAGCSEIEGLTTTFVCDQRAVSATLRKVNVLLVMDRSASMDDPFTAAAGGAGGGGGGDSSKWESMRAALAEALTATQSIANYGLMLYPDKDADAACAVGSEVDVAVGPGSATVGAILDAVAPPTQPGGNTPVADALDAALTYFVDGAGQELPGDRYVLLATDGGPNCNDTLSCAETACTVNLDGSCPAQAGNCCEVQPEACVDHARVVERIEALRAAGIDTFVIGIPGSEAYEAWLNDFAEAGGRAVTDAATSYYRVDSAAGTQGLTETLERIARNLVTDCTVELDEPPENRAEINVAVDCTVVPQNGTTSSWTLSDDGLRVTIEGALCDQIRTTGVERIDVILGCPIVG